MKAAMDNNYHQELRTTTIPTTFSTAFVALLHLPSQISSQIGTNIENQANKTKKPRNRLPEQ